MFWIFRNSDCFLTFLQFLAILLISVIFSDFSNFSEFWLFLLIFWRFFLQFLTRLLILRFLLGNFNLYHRNQEEEDQAFLPSGIGKKPFLRSLNLSFGKCKRGKIWSQYRRWYIRWYRP